MHLGPLLPLMRRYSSSRYGGGVLTAVGLIPSAPLLVPELSGNGSPDVDEVRKAALRVGYELADAAHWTIVGAGQQPNSDRGTFRGFGADVVVSLTAASTDQPDVRMALPFLVGAWLRTVTAPNLDSTPLNASRSVDGHALFDRLEASSRHEAVLFVADGSTMLTARAPGAFDADAPAFQHELDTAIESGSWTTLIADEFDRFGAGPSRPTFEVLGAVLSHATWHTTGQCLAPFGVGYHFRTWSR